MAVMDQVITDDYAIYNGDCMEVVSEMPDNSIDMAVYSPPFAALFTYSSDIRDMSNCYDKCAANWPPFTATDGAMADGAYSIITRKDGSKQWAHDGKPLYFWIKDSKPGDTTGNGVLNVWDVARP